MLIYKGTLNNVYKKADFTDKTTGQTTIGKWQLEFLTKKEINKGEGFQTVLEKISIPGVAYPKEYIEQIGNEVQVNVDTMINNRQVILYGV